MHRRVLASFVLVALAGCDLAVPPNVDGDNDLRRDTTDNCPTAPNPDQSDYDGDGIGDACDECLEGGSEDADNDFIPDGCDGCVDNGEDADEDLIPDNCDACVESNTDADNDLIDDACDPCIGNGIDSDGDEIPDNCDDDVSPCMPIGQDSDSDGIDDACDACDNGPNFDEDGDGLFDACDNCPHVPNPGQEDTGDLVLSDGVGSACDRDVAINYQIFDGFNAQNPGWYVQGAGWLVDAGTLKFSGGATTYRTLGEGVYGHVTVSTLVQAAPLSSQAAVSVFLASDYPQPAPLRVVCSLVPTWNNNTGTLTLEVWGAQGLVEQMSADKFSIAAATLVLVLDDVKKEITCSDAKGLTLYAGINDENVSWIPGISANGAATEFLFYDVVTR